MRVSCCVGPRCRDGDPGDATLPAVTLTPPSPRRTRRAKRRRRIREELAGLGLLPADDAEFGVNSDDLNTLLVSVEKEKILRALEETRWNKTAAAKFLGISFGALRYRMQKLDLE